MIMSKLKTFMRKHPGIFSIQFGVFIVLLIASIVALALLRDRNEGSSIHDDPSFPPVEDQIHEPVPQPDHNFDFTNEVVTNDNISAFITLGQYKGLPAGGSAVTQQDLENFLEMYSGMFILLQEESANRPVLDGDFVIIDYRGIMDGVPFQGGTDEDAGLSIGSGQFIPGFEEQIIGHNVGDEFDIHLSFPEDYHADDLAGQDVIFEIKLKKILIESTSEQNRDWVWDHEMRQLVSYDEYLSLIRGMLESDTQGNEWSQVLDMIIQNSTIHKLPSNEIDDLISSILKEISYDYSSYGMDMDIEDLVVEITGGEMTYEEFIEYELKPYAIDTVIRNLVFRAIAAQEGLVVTDADFEEFITEHGFETIDYFTDLYSEEFLFIIILSLKVEELVMGHTVQN